MSKSIEFATAKLAKEKGFDELSQSGLGFSLYNKEGQKITSSLYSSREKNNCFIRTSQDEFAKWLREKHRIHVSVNPWKDEMSDASIEDVPEEGFQILYEGNIIDVNDDWNTFSDFSYHHSHEECLEALLVEALKLIDTVVLDYSKISNVVLDGVSASDYPDFADAYVFSADYDDRDMTGREIDLLNLDSGFIHQKVFEQLN